MTDLITQVSQESTYGASRLYDQSSNVDYESNIHLNVRNHRFTITRDELMSLPESILLCLFPNGVFLDANGQAITNLTEDDTVFVNFEPACFEYIIDVFGRARRDLLDAPLAPSPLVSSMQGTAGGVGHARESAALVLHTKPAIIVLREDLDYYVIPPVAGLDADNIRQCKLAVALHLLGNRQIFSGLGFDPQLDPTVPQHLGPAEKHLLDMLCLLGFETDGEWGSRLMEPSKCVISSLLLVRLLTPQQRQQQHEAAEDSPLLGPVVSNVLVLLARKPRLRIANLALSASRAALRSLLKTRRELDSSQTKLLLFWRKPARKCWWSNDEVEIDVAGMVVRGQPFEKMKVSVHVRRVWTLELLVIGVN